MQTIDDAETLRCTVWNPAEFSYRGESIGGKLSDVDAELARALGAIPEHADGAAERARETLNRAARHLQELDWRSMAPGPTISPSSQSTSNSPNSSRTSATTFRLPL